MKKFNEWLTVKNSEMVDSIQEQDDEVVLGQLQQLATRVSSVLSFTSKDKKEQFLERFVQVLREDLKHEKV